MSKPRLIAVILWVLLGLVFLGQGLGYIPGSFMSGDPLWAATGSVLLGVALALALARGRVGS